LDPYDYYSSPESKANAEARKAAMQKPQDGTTSSDEDEVPPPKKTPRPAPQSESSEGEATPPPKAPRRRKREPVVESSADEGTPAPKTPKRPPPKVNAAPKAASSSSDDSDSDDDVEVPVPQLPKTGKPAPSKSAPSKSAPSKSAPSKPAASFFEPKTSSKNRNKDANVNAIPDHLKPKRALKAPVSKPKVRYYVPGDATDEEVKIVAPPPSAKKKKADPASVLALNAYEALKKFAVRLHYGPSGRLETQTGLSGLMKAALYDANNHRLPILFYTKDTGAILDKDTLDIVAGMAFTLAIDASIEHDRFKKIRKRWEDEKEGEFFQAIVYFVAKRRNQAHAKPTNMARGISFRVFGLDIYIGDRKALAKAIRALLRNKAFLHDGKLVFDKKTKTFEWAMTAQSKKKPYACPQLVQLLSMVFMGKSKALKKSAPSPSPVKDTNNGRNSAGYDWSANVFPDATFLKKELEEGQPLPKQIPVPMMAYAAMSFELALKEWNGGICKPVALDDSNMKDIYVFHVKKLNDMPLNTRSLLLQHVYKRARAWTPIVEVEVFSGESDGAEVVHTDEALALYGSEDDHST
ncbi:hypothetical protein PENSPDRAFT_686963, partial [Peniophora sp. CONT]